MVTLRIVAALTTLLLMLGSASCDRRSPSVKAQERLVELRFEQKELLDELYQRYGHGELASAVKEEAAQKSDDNSPHQDSRIKKELLRVVGSAAVEVDRAAFDSHCTVAGGGERPSILSEKGQAFFALADVLATCQQVAKLEIQIDAQEAELARLRTRE